jgi:choline kinase
MRAVLLCAGRGRRLGHEGPKCLLPIGGRSLLARHLDILPAAGIDALTIVTGYCHTAIEAALGRLSEERSQAGRPLGLTVRLRYNDRFAHGSIVSLRCAAADLLAGGVWMDADVLYPPELLARLVRSVHGCCVLLDPRGAEQGEEMMLAVRDGRVRRIARRVGSGWDLTGESVGFFKVDAAGGRVIKRILDDEIAAGRLDQEHEDGLDRALDEIVFGYETVADLDWTEIDFPADVERATSLARRMDGRVGRPG